MNCSRVPKLKKPIGLYIYQCCFVAALLCTSPLQGQTTTINLNRQSRNSDFASFPFTRPTTVGSPLPGTCLTGQLFFLTSAPEGQNIYGCFAPNSWGVEGAITSTLYYYQTVESNSSALVQEPTVNFSTAFSAANNPASSRTDIDLATVNSSTGTFGSSTEVPVITVNSHGLITAVSTAAVDGSGSSSSSLSSGTLATMPSTCTPGGGIYLYFATDQPPGEQLYTCSTKNAWTQLLNIGPSGGLAMKNGSLDLVSSVTPGLENANVFTGSNGFAGPYFQINGTTTDPNCKQASDVGKLWVNTTDPNNSTLEVCLAVAGQVTWVTK